MHAPRQKFINGGIFMINNLESKVLLSTDVSNVTKVDSSSHLKEMVTCVEPPKVTSIPEKRNIEIVTYVNHCEKQEPPPREPVEMVKVIDNSKPKQQPLVEMVKIVEKPVPVSCCLPVISNQQKLITNNPTDNKPIMFYSDSDTFTFDGQMLFYNNTPFINCQIAIIGSFSSEEENYYQCVINVKGKFFNRKVSACIFHDTNWVFSTLGVATFGDPNEAKKALRRYLDFLVHNFDINNKVDMFAKPGWTEIEGKLVYLTPQGVIGHEEIKAISKYGQDFSSLQVEHKAFAEYLRMIDISSSPAGGIMIIYTAMSLINTLFRKANFTPKFLLFAHGHRGSYKTSLSLALSQISKSDRPQYTLKATKAGLESAFKIHRSAVMLIDDLAPTQDIHDLKSMKSNLEVVVRAFGDGTGHKRATVDYEAEGGAIITGEIVAGACESSLARCLFIKIEKECVNVNLLSLLQNNRNMVEQFVLSFISNLSYLINECGENIIGFIETRGKEIRNSYRGKYYNERFGEYQSQLQVTLEILMMIAKKFCLLSTEEINILYSRYLSAINEVIIHNNRRLKEQSPITLLCNSIRLAMLDEKVPTIKLGTIVSNSENVILTDENHIYITQKLCCEIANQYLRDNDSSTPDFTVKTVADTLETNGIIKSVLEGKDRRKAIKLPKYGSRRFMKLNIEKFEKFINIQ